MDPLTVIGLASTAFNALKKGISVGKDMQSMGIQLSTWASAISDLDFLESKVKNPPWYKVLTGHVQSDAIEIFAAKQQAKQMRNELRQFIQFSYGMEAWEEFLKIEGQIRKQKRDMEYRKLDLEQKIKDFAIGGLIFFSGIGILLLIAYGVTR